MFGLESLPRSLDAALRDAQHEKSRIRASALADLARHAADGDARAVNAITAALRGDPSAEVRAAAAIALADGRAKGAVEIVLRATADENMRVRQMALIALGELAGGTDARVANVVREALGD